MNAEVDVLAALVHGAASLIHVQGVRSGRLDPRLAGAATALHLLGVAYNARRGQRVDAAAHVLAIAAAFSSSRLLHAAAVAYDAHATYLHAREVA